MNVPESHVIAEGRTLRAAIESAATMLGVPAARVEHKIDMSHFRSAQGVGIGADTVKIFAWAKEQAAVAPLLEAENWAKELLRHMGVEGKVQAALAGNSVSVGLDVGEAAPHLVGKRGVTIGAVRHLMELAMKDRFSTYTFQIEVSGGARQDQDDRPRRDDRREGYDRPREDRPRDDRPREDRPPRDDRPREDRPPRDDRARDDRPPRDDRPRDDRPRDDRPPRDDRREGYDRPPRDDRRDDRPREGFGRRERPYDDRPRDDRPRDDRPRGDDRSRDRRRKEEEEELRKLARKLAQRVLATGKPEVVRRELNSYDRRVVHLEVAAVGGVGSRSIGEGPDRRVEIIPAEGTESAPSGE